MTRVKKNKVLPVNARSVKMFRVAKTTLEATQGQIDGLCSQLPYKCHLEEVASVGD